MSKQVMRTSEVGIKLIKGFESLRLKAYQDSVGVWTIGYGHTGEDVQAGMRISTDEAETLLKHDLRRFEAGVSLFVRPELNQNEFDALVSFTFNVGLGAFGKSTMQRLINEGRWVEAAEEFPKWNKAGGKILSGLIKRRAAERELFERDKDA